MQFVDTAIPDQASMAYEHITPVQLQRYIRRNPQQPPAQTAGVAKTYSICQMTCCHQTRTCSLGSNRATHGHPPYSLEWSMRWKSKNIRSGSTIIGRPITVFSLLYRAWNSVRSRQILKFLTDKVPMRCFGNSPQRMPKISGSTSGCGSKTTTLRAARCRVVCWTWCELSIIFPGSPSCRSESSWVCHLRSSEDGHLRCAAWKDASMSGEQLAPLYAHARTCQKAVGSP